MTVGEAMTAARKKAGLSQEELAKISGLKCAMIGRYERDDTRPRIDNLELLADSLGISIDEYIGHEVQEVNG